MTDLYTVAMKEVLSLIETYDHSCTVEKTLIEITCKLLLRNTNISVSYTL